jgi:hypothetical protein
MNESPPAKKRNHRRTGGKVGKPPFKPTQAQRELVTILIGMKMTWDQVRLLVINPRTGEPIAKTALSKHFRRELAEGGAQLKALIASKYHQALQNGDCWAVRMGLRNKFGWLNEGSTPLPADSLELEGDPKIQIEFVLPTAKRLEEPKPPIDVTPPRPPDYSMPAIEAPRPRFRTETGAVYEMPRSVFEQPDPKGWMK